MLMMLSCSSAAFVVHAGIKMCHRDSCPAVIRASKPVQCQASCARRIESVARKELQCYSEREGEKEAHGEQLHKLVASRRLRSSMGRKWSGSARSYALESNDGDCSGSRLEGRTKGISNGSTHFRHICVGHRQEK
jgi:hypothetical protein